MRLLPDTLAGRAILVLLIGLGLFHVGSIWIYQIGLENMLRTTREDDLAEHLVSLKRAVAGLPLEDRERAAHALSTAALEVHWSPISSINDVPTDAEGIRALRDRLKQLAPEIGEERLRFGYADEGRPSGETAHSGPHVLLGSLQLSDGSWVNVRASLFEPSVASEHGALGSLTAMALGILIVSVLLVRWMAAPLETLARAADRIGVDPNPIPLSPTGPREVRHAAHAFNAMQQRIRRLIDDRTQTLAAVSHDLKTPITRLRLRAGFIPNEELRQTIEDDLGEMEAMLDSTLAFLRGDMSDEEAKVVDVATVLSTICDDFADRGKPVVLSGASHGRLKCRPLALKRAIYNLVDNAIKYGARADVALRNASGELVITVEDRGPGIPEIEREKVFDPFYRVEESRSRDTGGTGLGLTVARTIVRSHGGDILFEDRGPEGLRVVVHLPKTQDR